MLFIDTVFFDTIQLILKKMTSPWDQFEAALQTHGLSFESIKGGVKDVTYLEGIIKEDCGIKNNLIVAAITAEFIKRGGMLGKM
jgi:hypothetical protein